MKNEIFHMQVCTYVQTCYAQKTSQKGEKMVSILEYDKEWEEKKLRKAEYEAGRSEGIEIGKSEGIEIGKTEGIEIGKSKGIEIGRDKAMAEFVCNMIKYGFSIEKIAEVTGKNAEQIQTILNQQAP